ncbi:MAG TPA: superoxide dismutase, partial [Candidatus Dormibacteraeota bacterium]|nr:superoxide dismutase [Candidatus Dormibacteraeota bacterium]
MITRRDAVKKTALTVAAASVALPATLSAQAPAAAAGPFKLPALPYAFDALEPHLDAKTMEIHHDRHHQTYVTNLNKALAGQGALAEKSIEEIVRHLEDIPGNL